MLPCLAHRPLAFQVNMAKVSQQKLEIFLYIGSLFFTLCVHLDVPLGKVSHTCPSTVRPFCLVPNINLLGTGHWAQGLVVRSLQSLSFALTINCLSSSFCHFNSDANDLFVTFQHSYWNITGTESLCPMNVQTLFDVLWSL